MRDRRTLPGDPLLERVRQAYEARDFAAVVAELEPLAEARLLETPELGFMLGRPEDALDLTLRLEEPCWRHGSARLRRRRLNIEGMLHFEGGDAAEAERAWLRLLEDASEAGDAAHVAHACNNLGVVYTVQARTDEALTGYERALAAYHRLGDREGMAQANQNLGIVYREKQRLDEADEHFVVARDHATALGHERLLGRVEAERALLLLRMRDPELASATVRRAVERMRAAGDTAGTGEALRAAGIVELARGRPDRARPVLEQALATARKVGNPLLEAETLLALAHAPPDSAATTDPELLDAARARFGQIGATGWGSSLETWLDTLLA